MLRWLWLIPALPLLGYVILALHGRRLSRGAVAWTGVGSVGLAALVAAAAGVEFLTEPPPGDSYTLPLWTWMSIGDFTPRFSLRFDALALVMTWIVTGVGFLIHLYSADYMIDDAGYARFFAYMNLFVAAMLVLVLGDNLLFLYVGWEGVGLASYLLIGFWYQDATNGTAARKAFVITRIGDTALLLGLFILVLELGTLDIQALMARAEAVWGMGSTTATIAAALLLGGAVGKSAQLPLHTWLPDAMAGPTPVSALIHAATMVTAGVYLIARTHTLFELSPVVMHAVAVIGALTLLIAGFTALVQNDIKRILAFSTMSQIGYMFLALGVGAWSAAVFHLMTHAFFKALLFLAAGAVILALHHEQDIFKMGGLRKRLPFVFWTFTIGAAALAALPFVTAGFFSKDKILIEVWSAQGGASWLWAAGALGAFVTGLYIFRLVFIAFCGAAKTPVGAIPGWRTRLPLLLLAVLSVGGGWIELPPTLGDQPWFSRLVSTALPARHIHVPHQTEVMLQAATVIISLAGIALAWLLFMRHPALTAAVRRLPGAESVARFWHGGWGFDAIYALLFVRPYIWFANFNRDDFADLLFRGTASLSRALHFALSRTQTGGVRVYAAGLGVGLVLVIALVGAW